MARSQTAQAIRLDAASRTSAGSRAARRLRRSGRVPGVVYGGGKDPIAFDVDGLQLRYALTHGSAVIDLSLDDGRTTPVILKEEHRHPVNGTTLHVDLLRVRLDQPIHAVVALELIGAEDAPGVKVGGVLEQVLHELNVEALPAAIPDAIRHDVSTLELHATVTLESVSAPEGVALLDGAETVIATVVAPSAPEEATGPEQETELVGEERAEAGEEGAAAGGEQAQEPASEASGSAPGE